MWGGRACLVLVLLVAETSSSPSMMEDFDHVISSIHTILGDRQHHSASLRDLEASDRVSTSAHSALRHASEGGAMMKNGARHAAEKTREFSKMDLLKAGVFGAAGGVATGFVTRATSNGDRSSSTMPHDAITGAITGVAANAMKQEQARRGMDMQGHNAHKYSAFLGAGVGTTSYFIKPNNDDLLSRIAAGIGGGIAGSLASSGKPSFKGDGQLNYHEFMSAFGDRKEISAAELSLMTGRSEPEMCKFIDSVGTTSGQKAEDGGQVSIADICMYLDLDNSGSLTIEELEPLFGLSKAAHLIASRDASEGLSEHHALLQGQETITNEAFYEWAKKWTREDSCNRESCEINPVSLSMMSMPDKHVDVQKSLSPKEALGVIKAIKKSLTDREVPNLGNIGAIEFKALWAYLTCPHCGKGDKPGENISITGLKSLVKDNTYQAKKLLLAILDAQYDGKTDYERAESKLKRQFDLLNPLQAFVDKVGEDMYKEYQKERTRLKETPE